MNQLLFKQIAHQLTSRLPGIRLKINYTDDTLDRWGEYYDGEITLFYNTFFELYSGKDHLIEFQMIKTIQHEFLHHSTDYTENELRVIGL